MLTAGDRRWSKRLSAGDGLPRMASTREKAGWHYLLFNPAEEPLPRSAPLLSIELDLPDRHTRYLGFEAHWLLAFCVISLIFGFAVKDIFKVKI